MPSCWFGWKGPIVLADAAKSFGVFTAPLPLPVKPSDTKGSQGVKQRSSKPLNDLVFLRFGGLFGKGIGR